MEPEQFSQFVLNNHIHLSNSEASGYYNIPKALWNSRLIHAVNNTGSLISPDPTIEDELVRMYGERKKSSWRDSKPVVLEKTKEAIDRLSVLCMIYKFEQGDTGLEKRRKKVLDGLGSLRQVLDQPASSKMVNSIKVEDAKRRMEKFLANLPLSVQHHWESYVKKDLEVIEKYRKKILQ